MGNTWPQKYVLNAQRKNAGNWCSSKLVRARQQLFRNMGGLWRKWLPLNIFGGSWPHLTMKYHWWSTIWGRLEGNEQDYPEFWGSKGLTHGPPACSARWFFRQPLFLIVYLGQHGCHRGGESRMLLTFRAWGRRKGWWRRWGKSQRQICRIR